MDSGEERVVSCEAGVGDARSTGEEAPKDPVEQEVWRRKAYEEAVKRAVQEESARRRACARENSARCKAHDVAMRRTAEEEAARRGVNAATLIKTLPTVRV